VSRNGRPVHLHTMFARAGGAARVAHLLGCGLSEAGWKVGHFSEIAEDGQVRISGRCRIPEADNGAIVHLHSTSDWSALLEGLPRRAGLVITMHDCALLTGGCVYPLDCASWKKGCPGLCPRRYPAPEDRCRKIRMELQRLDPVLVAPSRWLGFMARSVFPELRIRIVPNGIPWPEVQPGAGVAARKRLGIHPAAHVVLFAAHGGRKALIKGGAHWEPVWSGIKARLPGAVALFVGGSEVGRRDDLLLLPFVDREKMDLIMEASDLLVYPTLADNHPLVVLEAMAREVCVVAFNTGGVSEQIRHGRTGILVPVQDWDGLADACVETLCTRDGTRLGRAAWDFGRTIYSVERMVRDYEKIFNRLQE
jgi:glycosyltransferase involved in cell wall biosynthesis